MRKSIKIVLSIIIALALLRLCGNYLITNKDNFNLQDTSDATTEATNQYETLLNNDKIFLDCIIEEYANENNYTCLLNDKNTNHQICLYNLFSDKYDGILNCYQSARHLLLNIKQTEYWNTINEFHLNFLTTNNLVKFKMNINKDDLDGLILNLDDVAKITTS